MKDTNKKRFKLFDYQREGKGIGKMDLADPSGIKRFFVSLKDNFGKIVSVNMFFVIGNFPLLFLIITLSGYTKLPTILPFSDLFQNVNGLLSINGATPYMMSLYGVEGLQNVVLVNTPLTYVFYGISALTLLTFGIVNVVTAYILRNLAKGEPVFVWADFWYAVKRNWKQAIPFGMIDAFLNFLFIYNIYTAFTQTSDFLGSMLFWCYIILFVLYFFVRSYIYVQMVTFRLSVFKIFKNSLIFAVLGFKRNFGAFFGTLLMIALEFLFMFGAGSILVPFAVAMPLTVFFSISAYMKVFASYYKIKEVMIDPYLAEHPEEAQENYEDAEVIMRDDVTEKRRLEEIKKRNGIS